MDESDQQFGHVIPVVCHGFWFDSVTGCSLRDWYEIAWVVENRTQGLLGGLALGAVQGGFRYTALTISRWQKMLRWLGFEIVIGEARAIDGRS